MHVAGQFAIELTRSETNPSLEGYTCREILLEWLLMNKLNRITINPEVMNGQPCIRDMCLIVKRVLESLAIYSDWEELMAEYPSLERDDCH